VWKSTAGLQLHSGGRGIYVTFAATSYDPTVKVVACLRMKKTTMASTTKPKPQSTPKGQVTPSRTSTSPPKDVASIGSQGANLQGDVASSGSQGGASLHGSGVVKQSPSNVASPKFGGVDDE